MQSTQKIGARQEVPLRQLSVARRPWGVIVGDRLNQLVYNEYRLIELN
jgi:hypothetical protein